MTIAGCPLCGGQPASGYEAREMMLGTRERFELGECEACGTLVLLEPPADLGRYYPADYYSFAPPARRSAPLRAARRLRGRACLLYTSPSPRD